MTIALLAGEVSGDKYGALLARELKTRSPGIVLCGLGGVEMRSAGVEMLADIPFGTMGFTGVLARLPAFYAVYRRTVAALRSRRPDLTVFIDNPGFNLKVAQAVGKEMPCGYYIPPKIWAHGYGRIRVLKDFCRLVIPIFPFERDLYRREKVPGAYFGHPVTDIIEFNPDTDAFIRKTGLDGNRPVLGMLPGSRPEEIVRLMPPLLDIARRLGTERKAQSVFSAVDGRAREQQRRIMARYGDDWPVWEGAPYPLIKSAGAVLAACGTANLEIALLKRPLVVLYKTSPFNYAAARFVLQLKTVSPVNICLGEKAVPEYLQNFAPRDAAASVRELLDKGPLYARQTAAYEKLAVMFPVRDVTARVAGYLLEYMKKGCHCEHSEAI